jgi:hypothetical protein
MIFFLIKNNVLIELILEDAMANCPALISKELLQQETAYIES